MKPLATIIMRYRHVQNISIVTSASNKFDINLTTVCLVWFLSTNSVSHTLFGKHSTRPNYTSLNNSYMDMIVQNKFLIHSQTNTQNNTVSDIIEFFPGKIFSWASILTESSHKVSREPAVSVTPWKNSIDISDIRNIDPRVGAKSIVLEPDETTFWRKDGALAPVYYCQMKLLQQDSPNLSHVHGQGP